VTGDAIAALVAALATVPLARIAYRYGWRHAAPRLPAALLAELRTHKIECLGEPQERVTLELSLLLGADTTARDRDRHRNATATRGRSGATV
jgi:hypothetical protein